MAMTMNGEVQLAAPREAVWTKLNDPEVLKACIPGCEELEKTEDNGFRAVAKMKVGPVSARFKGRVTLSDLDPPNGYKISGEGEGGVAGFAKGGATVALTEKDGGTLLTYNVEAQIGGKLAQLGQRLINGAAKKLADEFFVNFAKAVQGLAFNGERASLLPSTREAAGRGRGWGVCRLGPQHLCTPRHPPPPTPPHHAQGPRGRRGVREHRHATRRYPSRHIRPCLR